MREGILWTSWDTCHQQYIVHMAMFLSVSSLIIWRKVWYHLFDLICVTVLTSITTKRKLQRVLTNFKLLGSQKWCVQHIFTAVCYNLLQRSVSNVVLVIVTSIPWKFCSSRSCTKTKKVKATETWFRIFILMSFCLGTYSNMYDIISNYLLANPLD